MKAEILDRQPPADTAAEEALLSTMILDQSKVDIVSPLVTDADFYDQRNGSLFAAFVELHEAGKPIGNTRMLIAELNKIGLKRSPADLARLEKGTPHHGPYYANRIREASNLRRLFALFTEGLQRVYEAKANAGQITNWLDAQLLSFGTRTDSPVRDIASIAQDVLDDLEDNGGTKRALLTGLCDIDETVGGMMPGEMVVIAGIPGSGKTALGTQIALHNATMDRPALICSLEMSQVEVAQRIICANAQVDQRKIRSGRLTREQRQRMIEAAAETQGLPLYVWSPPQAAITDIRAVARLQAKGPGLSLLVIDYLQLIRGSSPTQKRYESVTEISNSIKSLAKELTVPVIALAQFNREAAKGRPTMSMLRDSGSIEADADMIMCLHREGDDNNKVELIVDKHRHGERGIVELHWCGVQTRFADRSEGARIDAFDEFNEAG